MIPPYAKAKSDEMLRTIIPIFIGISMVPADLHHTRVSDTTACEGSI